MFLGSWEPSFNSISRRIALPKKIRVYLATSEIILSYGFETCIFGFDTKAWQKESAKQLASPLTDRDSRNLRRFFFSSAQLVKLDDQGRFVIPSKLLEWAKISKPIVIGAGDHFEIWEEKLWKGKLKELEISQK